MKIYFFCQNLFLSRRGMTLYNILSIIYLSISNLDLYLLCQRMLDQARGGWPVRLFLTIFLTLLFYILHCVFTPEEAKREEWIYIQTLLHISNKCTIVTLYLYISFILPGKCQRLLDRGTSPYAQLLATTTITKLVSRSTQVRQSVLPPFSSLVSPSFRPSDL